MKRFLRIKKSEWLPNSNTKMIHKDENGENFIGPPINAGVNETVAVEVSEDRMEDGYYHIIKIIA